MLAKSQSMVVSDPQGAALKGPSKFPKQRPPKQQSYKEQEDPRLLKASSNVEANFLLGFSYHEDEAGESSYAT